MKVEEYNPMAREADARLRIDLGAHMIKSFCWTLFFVTIAFFLKETFVEAGSSIFFTSEFDVFHNALMVVGATSMAVLTASLVLVKSGLKSLHLIEEASFRNGIPQRALYEDAKSKDITHQEPSNNIATVGRGESADDKGVNLGGGSQQDELERRALHETMRGD